MKNVLCEILFQVFFRNTCRVNEDYFMFFIFIFFVFNISHGKMLKINQSKYNVKNKQNKLCALTKISLR